MNGKVEHRKEGWSPEELEQWFRFHLMKNIESNNVRQDCVKLQGDGGEEEEEEDIVYRTIDHSSPGFFSFLDRAIRGMPGWKSTEVRWPRQKEREKL